MKQVTIDASMRERAVYDGLKAKHGATSTISPGFLSVEQVVVNNRNRYDFDIKKTGNESPTELKLDRNDIFVATGISMHLMARNTTRIGSEVLHSYPSAVMATSGATASHFESVYNGYTSLKIGSKVNIEKMSNQVFRVVPRTQTSSGNLFDDTCLNDVVYKLPTLLALHGTMDVALSMEFPSFAGILVQASTANFENRFQMKLHGFLVKGGASAK